MPTYARRQIVVEDMVGVYHCIARCVRGAFLCGVDSYTGKDYSHRKEWILDRMRELVSRALRDRGLWLFRDEQPSPSRAPQSTGHRRAMVGRRDRSAMV
jgi:hypothetical protein